MPENSQSGHGQSRAANLDEATKPADGGLEFAALVETVKRLRAPDGCPWDREQTHHSLVRYLLEESFELAEAIEASHDSKIVEELGDVLLQVVLHAQIASETSRFSIGEVADVINQKMIRRHPHVFGDPATGRNAADFRGITSDQVLVNWHSIKAAEKTTDAVESGSELTPAAKSGVDFRFDVPLAMPALLRAAKIGEKTRKQKFDWPDWRGVLSKIEEEFEELKAALEASNSNMLTPAEREAEGAPHDPVASEIGDMLFTLAQLARHRGIDPEQALRETNARFERRYGVLQQMAEDLTRQDGRGWESRSQEELEKLWQAAKAQLRQAKLD